MRFRPLPVLTVCTALAFALTIWLGFWQWDRYQQKLAQAAAPQPPIETLDGATPMRGAAVFVAGDWNGPGWRVFVPFAQPEKLVFADVGFVPGLEIPNGALALPIPDTVSGVRITPRRPGAFAAKPDPSRRAFYSIDLPAMAEAAGTTGVFVPDYYIAAPYPTADGGRTPNPFAVVAEPLPPARHLGYAVTWWGLAASLIGVYLALHARQGRLTFR